MTTSFGRCPFVADELVPSWVFKLALEFAKNVSKSVAVSSPGADYGLF